MSTTRAGARSQRRSERIWPQMCLKAILPGPRINPDAVRIMKQLYDIDMELTQRSKLLSELPPVDIVVTMGCNVNCPHLPCKHREDWGLDDPTGCEDEVFKETIQIIHQKVISLKYRIENGLFSD